MQKLIEVISEPRNSHQREFNLKQNQLPIDKGNATNEQTMKVCNT